ncbi:HNH endonuclease signature motif containing protein [Winogradskya humida]|uniref:HNH endonuclease n=1 Tax=Winogradskya humida TaxID=113566 RepID=A0ABQ3ZYQ9_9ACTN|nr:HNH endonuclease signature motif containing protein [Actinoplanes humidus]GIE23751.1 HNH endonuclease [Actinoplanes humidus]
MALVLAEVQQLGVAAAGVAVAPLWQLSDTELTESLRAARWLEQVARFVQARLARQGDARGLPAAQGYRSTVEWLRAVLVLDRGPARELAADAVVLDHPAVAQAVLDGDADLRQAVVIAQTVDAIPADLAGAGGCGVSGAGQIVQDAETTLIGMTGRLPVNQLRRAGERILTYVAPQVADRAERALLARQEARADRKRGLTLSVPIDGLVYLSGVLGVEDAATVQAALHPLCRPVIGDKRSSAQRRVDALLEVCRLALRSGELPADGGEPPQLSVTVAYDPLTQALGIGTTDTGMRVSADVVRRLACDARILPVVLDGKGQVLNVGRRRRRATGSLRRALHVRDGGCAFPDCELPSRWTDAHHIRPWTAGGRTDLANLVLLCRRHHSIVHDPATGWKIRIGPDRHPCFIPPPTIDPTQRPRRNLYHLRQ